MTGMAFRLLSIKWIMEHFGNFLYSWPICAPLFLHFLSSPHQQAEIFHSAFEERSSIPLGNKAYLVEKTMILGSDFLA